MTEGSFFLKSNQESVLSYHPSSTSPADPSASLIQTAEEIRSVVDLDAETDAYLPTFQVRVNVFVNLILKIPEKDKPTWKTFPRNLIVFFSKL